MTNHNKASRISDLQHTLPLLRSLYPSLTKSEQKIADVILRDPEASVFYTITDLAAHSRVGEASVVRLSRKLGFKGYQDFKLSIAQGLSSPTEQAHGEVLGEDDLATVMSKLTMQNKQAIEHTQALIQPELLQQAIEWLRQAERIHCFGVGSSGITAQDAKYRFMRLGYQADATSDAHIIAMNASLVSPQDIVVIVTVTGSTMDVVHAAELARSKGAKVIAITNHARSPVTRHSDLVLLAASQQTPLQGGAFASKLAQLHVLDFLTTGLSLAEQEKTYQALEDTAKSVLDKLY